MVAVPSALHLAAGLLAIAASTGVALALAGGGRRPVDGARTPTGPSGALRRVGVAGALAYAIGQLLGGALLGPEAVWAWLQVAGPAGLAAGLGPASLAGLPGAGLPGAGLLVPLAPTVPAYAAAAMAAVAATRAAWAGRLALPLALGLAVLGVGHALEPTQPVWAEWAVVVGALLIGAWLWTISSRRILAKLLTAFVSALLAMAILTAAVLSTVSSAELTADELDRLGRLADQLAGAVRSWPADAVADAQPLSRSATSLVGAVLSPQDAADVYDLSLSGQDFFLTVDRAGDVVNSHPPGLAASVRLALLGDPVVADLRQGGATAEAGGLLSTGGTLVGFGAVALRDPSTRPEDPPAGVLVTGRLLDDLWAAQQATALDVGVIGAIAGEPAVTSDGAGDDAVAVLDGLGEATRADLAVAGQVVFAASAPLGAPERGDELGRLVVTSTQEVIAALERGQNQRVFLAAIVGAALALLVAVVVIRRLTRPILQLTDVARRIGEGDLTTRSGLTSADEVGVLAATVDEMAVSRDAQRRDLTDSADREARLRGRLESVTTSMGDGRVAVDVDGRIITFNPAAEVLTGRRAADAVGRPLEDVLVAQVLGDTGVADPVTDPVTDPVADHVADHVGSARLLLLRADGSRIPVAATTAPVRTGEGAVLGRVLVLRDISRELEVEQMKTEFLSNVSHELRTPLTPIKGYAQVLARRELDPDRTRQFAAQILDATDRLERIVGMIVDFAALDSGRVRQDVRAVDLAQVVEEAVAAWRAALPEREFALRVHPPLPPVSADPAYLRRCLDELVDNAVKFSPDGEPVEVCARHDGSEVELQVLDHGVGIDGGATGRLFGDVVQVDGTETRHYGGLGLGLGLVKRILDGIGATADVRSSPGRGTTVTVRLLPAGPVPVPPLPEVVPDVVVPPPPPA